MITTKMAATMERKTLMMTTIKPLILLINAREVTWIGYLITRLITTVMVVKTIQKTLTMIMMEFSTSLIIVRLENLAGFQPLLPTMIQMVAEIQLKIQMTITMACLTFLTNVLLEGIIGSRRSLTTILMVAEMILKIPTMTMMVF